MIRVFPELRVIALTATLACVLSPLVAGEAKAQGRQPSYGTSMAQGYYNTSGDFIPRKHPANGDGFFGSSYAPKRNDCPWYPQTNPAPPAYRQPPIYGTLGAGSGFVQPYMRRDGTVVAGHYHRKSY